MEEQIKTRVCPRCTDALLTEIDYAHEKVDVCDGCGGIYFDVGEMRQLNQLVDDFFDVKLKEQEIANVPDHERDFKPACPGCSTEMKPHQIGQVWVDQCPKCEGLWLDQGEISALHASHRLILQNINLFLRLSQ